MSNLYVTQTVNGDLQPVKVNGESSALEIAQNEVKVKSLEIDGTGICREPTVNNQIANKQYVDDNAGGGAVTALNNATENELVTIGSTTTELDAESNLTFDGSTLKVKYDSLNFFTTAVAANGATTLSTTDIDGTSGNLTLDVDGKIVIDADGGNITLQDGGSTYTPVAASDATTKTYVDTVVYTGKAYSSTVIKVYPTDFRVNDDYARLPNMVEDDTTDTLGMRVGHTNEEAYAFVSIPAGYSATHVQVHASANTSLGAKCYSFNYATGATVELETLTLNTNTNTTDIDGDSLDLVIKYMGLSTATIVYGATVTIAAN